MYLPIDGSVVDQTPGALMLVCDCDESWKKNILKHEREIEKMKEWAIPRGAYR